MEVHGEICSTTFCHSSTREEDLDKYIEALLDRKEERQPTSIIGRKDNFVIEQGSTEQSDLLLQKTGEQDVIQSQEEQEKSIDQDIERFSDQNEEIRQQILRAVHEFSSSNPREVKRFLNVFRFYYFLRAARISRHLSVPSLEQLTDWIILSLKWPQVTRWLHSSPACERGKLLTNITVLESQIHLRLKLLEDIGEKCYNDSKKEWTTKLESVDGLKPYSNMLINDKGLENFFRHQGSMEQLYRLSSAVGTGFF